MPVASTSARPAPSSAPSSALWSFRRTSATGAATACPKACPTDSIQFGPLDELRERADKRLAKLQAERWNGAQLYGRDPDDGVGGFGAFFLLLDEPEVYGLPPDPVVPTKNLAGMWANTAVAAAATLVGAALAFIGGRG